MNNYKRRVTKGFWFLLQIFPKHAVFSAQIHILLSNEAHVGMRPICI